MTCPMGKQSISWLPNTYPKNGMMWEVRFTRKDCTPCPHRAQCTRAKKEPRLLGLQAREQYEALQAARQRQTTDAFAQQYAPRAGIESTHAQGIRRCGLRQARYRGLARTHLQHLATAASPERRAAGGVVRRDAAGEDTLLPLCCPEGSVGIRHQCQHSCHWGQ